MGLVSTAECASQTRSFLFRGKKRKRRDFWSDFKPWSSLSCRRKEMLTASGHVSIDHPWIRSTKLHVGTNYNRNMETPQLNVSLANRISNFTPPRHSRTYQKMSNKVWMKCCTEICLTSRACWQNMSMRNRIFLGTRSEMLLLTSQGN